MKLWDCFLQKLDQQFGKETITRWVRSLNVHEYDAGNLYLHASDSFQMMWFEEHIRPVLNKSFVNNNGRPIKVHITVGEAKPTPKEAKREKFEDRPIKYEPDDLLPYCQFKDFVIDNNNILAFEVLKKVSEQKSKAKIEAPLYNPIYLYGPPGCGKTHLLQSVTSTLLKNGFKCFYVNALTFTNHVVSAIRKGDMQAFRNHYRHLDYLIIDDVQQFARKNATQEELFHTFNTLHTATKQIIIGANLAPNFLDGIEERLVSRFEWGITLPLSKLSAHEHLLSLLQKRVSFYEFSFERSLQEYILSLFSEVRQLVKVLDALLVHIQIQQLAKNGDVLLSSVKDYIDDLHKKEGKEKITPEKIISMVADLFDIKIEDIIGKSQSRDCALPRQIAMYLLRSELKMPYMKIGNVFSRDHSTVMTSVKAITSHVDKKDREITFYLQDIQRKLVSFG